MSLLKYFKPGNALPTVEQTELPNHAVCSANHAVERMLEKEKCEQGEDSSGSRKCKYTMSFTAENRAKVGKYAAENGVAMARKHFKQLNLSESTVGYFRKKYLTEVAKQAKVGDSSAVTKLPIQK